MLVIRIRSKKKNYNYAPIRKEIKQIKGIIMSIQDRKGNLFENVGANNIFYMNIIDFQNELIFYFIIKEQFGGNSTWFTKSETPIIHHSENPQQINPQQNNPLQGIIKAVLPIHFY